MSDYKHTLNLPQTDFPMKANLAQREPETLARWQAQDLYRRMGEMNRGKPTFLLHDGPPYANGELHLGHAINKSLKDFVVKAKHMSGFAAPYVPGWDCHGLPIEHKVEKDIGRAGDKVNHAEFRQACREYAARQVALQKRGFIRLGVFGDWDAPYLTMDRRTEADTVRALIPIIRQGHLQRGYKPVYWSVVGASALAEAEVEYRDKESFAIDVRFPVADKSAFARPFGIQLGEEPAAVVIWTTTPWTLPANQAVCLHPDLDYALVSYAAEAGRETILVAADMVDGVMARYGAREHELLGRAPGRELENLRLRHPFIAGKTVPLILGGHVTTEAGTGAVHTAPDHGLDDFHVGERYALGTLNLIDDNGVFVAAAGEFAGEHVYKVDEHVIAVLRRAGALVAESRITHSYAHCWRTKTPLIYRATPQWFISMDGRGLREACLAATEQVTWLPEWGRARMELMLKGSPDWCVSRQRAWGTPLALFVHKRTGELHPRTEQLLEEVAQRIETAGIEAWFDLEPAELLGEDAADYEKVTDTLDVWFDSGVTHHSVLGRREELGFPADLYLEGSDQHRGWFQSSLKTAVAMHGRAPYRQVLTHGFFVDAQGRKMSKSLGNTVAPAKIIERYGADILRLWVAATDFRGEMSVSEDIFKRVADAYRRIRNTARFMLANLNGFTPERSVAPGDMIALDHWVVRRCQRLRRELLARYDDYSFIGIYQQLHNFCVTELGGFYLDIIKDRQYTCGADSLARRSAQTAMYHVADMLARLMAPILSFTAEEIWRHLPGERAESVFLAGFGHEADDWEERSGFGDDTWDTFAWVKEKVNKALENGRDRKLIGSGLGAHVTLYCSADIATELAKLGDELRFLLIVSGVEVKELPAGEGEAGFAAVDTGTAAGSGTAPGSTAAPGSATAGSAAASSAAAAGSAAATDSGTAAGDASSPSGGFPLPVAVAAVDGAVDPERLWVGITPSSHPKCVRCWHHRDDVGVDSAHPEICGRCVSNIAGSGEERRFA